MSKRILRALCLPDWLAALVVFPAFAWVIYQLAAGQTEGWQAYASYGLSAYALVLVCVRVPGIIRAFRTGFEAHPNVQRAVNAPMVQRYRSDAVYRASLSLYIGLGINLFNAAFQGIMVIAQRSLWFGALAGYYLLLTLMRGLLSRYAWKNCVGSDLRREWQRYLACGITLLFLNLALSTVVALVVRRGSGFSYPGITVYVMALYAFYAIIHGIWNLCRLKHQHSPVLRASIMVSFVKALVSMLSLETAMLDQFGGDSSPIFRKIMTGATGAAVCALVLAVAGWMIFRAAKQLKSISKGAFT
ncbi:MAG: hypothetical protein J6A48_03950 [Clostridia bacterium]|nr:hypothetical protein [Clostridia bacterium]